MKYRQAETKSELTNSVGFLFGHGGRIASPDKPDRLPGTEDFGKCSRPTAARLSNSWIRACGALPHSAAINRHSPLTNAIQIYQSYFRRCRRCRIGYFCYLFIGDEG